MALNFLDIDCTVAICLLLSPLSCNISIYWNKSISLKRQHCIHITEHAHKQQQVILVLTFINTMIVRVLVQS